MRVRVPPLNKKARRYLLQLEDILLSDQGISRYNLYNSDITAEELK